MLEEPVPSEEELKQRREFRRKMAAISGREPLTPGPFPSAEEMIREGRER